MDSSIKESFEKTSQHMAENVRNLRKEHGLTQKEMAKILEISVYSLRKIEKGEIPKRITIKILIDICFYFDVTPSQILGI